MQATLLKSLVSSAGVKTVRGRPRSIHRVPTCVVIPVTSLIWGFDGTRGPMKAMSCWTRICLSGRRKWAGRMK
eukprot:3528355-Rhodomonas_salina.1